MKSCIYLFCILIIALFVSVSGCRNAGKWLVKKDEPVHADALVILSGSIADRVLQAADLYKMGLADKVIIIEESMGAYKALEARGVHIISNTVQVCDAIVKLGIPVDIILILPGDATSTQMEAMIIKEYLSNKPGIDTLLVVSSATHTRRASMIFNTAFRKAEEPVYILFSPSIYTNFNPGKWWHYKEGIQTVLMEYIKMVNFWIFELKETIG